MLAGSPRFLVFAALVVSLACRKADPEASAPPVAERPVADARPEVVAPAVATALDAAVALDPAALDVRRRLASATAIVVYAVDPEHAHSLGREPTATDFHGFPIRKTVPLPDGDIAAVVAAVSDGVGALPPEAIPACFSPHHGLRLTTPAGTIDLVICFACAQIYVYDGDAKLARVTTSRAADPALARYVGATPDHDQPWR